MVTRVVNGTISGGYTLDPQYNTLSISQTGEIIGGKYGVVSQHLTTVINYGSVVGSSSASIDLRAGGVVNNGSATVKTALINQGVYIFNAPGTVNNFATITAGTNSVTGQYIFGVYMNDGGSVTNGSRSNYGAYIGGAGVKITNASGTVTNLGNIEANNPGGVGVSLYAGLVNNGSVNDTSALISGAAVGLATYHNATSSNFGTISSGGLGVQWAGGAITNGPSGDIKAKIVGAYGIEITGGASLKNFGAIQGASGGGVYINKIAAGASVTVVNGASTDRTALIMGATYGIFANASAATVTNYGTIVGVGGTAVQFNAASDTLILEGGSSLVGVARGGGGTLLLASGKGTITGLGTSFTGFGSYVVSSGGVWTVSGTNAIGSGTTLTNHATLSVTGAFSESGSFSNLGTVTGRAGGIALQMTGGALGNAGVITGGAGGAGGVGGMGVSSTAGYLTSSGSITGGAGGGSQGAAAGGAGGIALQSTGGSLTNGGVLIGGAGGAAQAGAGGVGGTAVMETGGAFTNRSTATGGVGGAAGSAGVGGAGGVGVSLAGGGLFANSGTDLIRGGAGGGGGGGGAGGIAAYLTGGYLTNLGVIFGGVGGVGSRTGNGAGGVGAYVSGVGDLVNKGQINGGAAGGGGVAAVGAIISGAGTLDNFGTISGGAYSVDINGAGGVLKVETGSLLNGAVQGGGGTLELASGTGTITNIGATGTISGTMAVTFSGFGSYQIDTGLSWTLAGTTSLGAGATFSDNGKVSSGGVLTASGTISGTGSLTITGGTATIGAGAVVTVASLSLGAGSMSINESLAYQGVFSQGAQATLILGSNDQLTLSNASRLSGLLSGAGTLSVASASFGAFTIGGTDVVIDTGNVTQTGAVSIGAGRSGNAALQIANGATWTMGGQVVMLNGAEGSYLDDEGTIVGLCVTGPSEIQDAITVGGVIEAATGILILESALTGNGALKIDSGATLEVGSSVATTLTATLTGSNAILALRHTAVALGATSFAATISGFAAGDAIDLMNTIATGASVNANDQLVIVGGTKTLARLQLTGNYSGDTFTTVSDGAGGTNIAIAGGQMQPPQLTHAFVAAMAGFAPSFAAHALESWAPPRNAFHTTLFVREA